MEILDVFNNIWVLFFSGLLLFAIIKKISNLNKPFDESKFIEQYQNQQKLKKKLNFDNFHQNIPKITSFILT